MPCLCQPACSWLRRQNCFILFSCLVCLAWFCRCMRAAAPKKPGEPSELKEVLQEAAEAMSLDKETMEKEVEQAVSAFEENIGAEELDGGEKQ